MVVVRNREPDGRWFGAEPELYAEKRGAGVDGLIKRVDEAAQRLSLRPGIQRLAGAQLEHLHLLDRPGGTRASDRPAGNRDRQGLPRRLGVRPAPSGSGFQVSLGGLFGVAASGVEGLEFNVLGLNFGLGPAGLKLPLVGRIGPASRRR